jgi:hypothetical protein
MQTRTWPTIDTTGIELLAKRADRLHAHLTYNYNWVFLFYPNFILYVCLMLVCQIINKVPSDDDLISNILISFYIHNKSRYVIFVTSLYNFQTFETAYLLIATRMDR